MARVMSEGRKNEPGMPFAKPAHADKVTFAGFLTLNYVAHSVARSTNNAEIMKALALSPHHGETPIPFSVSAGPGSLRFDLEVPADAMTDSSSAIVNGGPSLRSTLESSPLR
jgi:hypothetical protein